MSVLMLHLRFRFQEIGLGGKQSENYGELSAAMMGYGRFCVGLSIPENEASRREEILRTCFRTGFRHKLPCYDA